MFSTPVIRPTTLSVIVGCLLIGYPFPSTAQSSKSHSKTAINIRGMVIDSKTKAQLSHVTIALINPHDSQPHKVTRTTEDGTFKIQGVQGKRYDLVITSAGYKDTILFLPNTKSSFDAGAIPLLSLLTPLQKVEVLAVKPLIQQEVDKLIYNVDADPESKVSDALDIIRKVPLLTIDADDNILLNGNNNFRILVNGKPSLMFLQNQADIFRNIDASVINKIEVISVPSAKYQSQGIGGIINIITYKKTIGGFTGGLNVRTSAPQAINASGNVSFNVAKFTVTSNASYSKVTNPTTTSKYSREDKTNQNRIEQTGTGTSESSGKNAGITLAYDINDLNVLTTALSFNSLHNESNGYQTVNLFDSFNARRAITQRRNSNSIQPVSTDVMVDYQRMFKNNDRRQLSLSYKLSSYNDRMQTYFTVPVTYKSEEHTSENRDDITEQVAAVDYVQPIKNHTLEIGIGNEHRRSASSTNYNKFDIGMNSYIPDPSQANKFNYSEKIYTGYTSLTFKMSDWSLSTGVRIEQAHVDVNFVTSGTRVKRDYLNIIPNVGLSHRFGMNSVLLSYSQRLNRPELYYLDPFIDKTDPWNVSYGNPGLLPAKSHVFNLVVNVLNKKTSINVSAFHQYSSNSIQQVTTLGADTVSRTTYDNIAHNRSSTIALGVNVTVLKRLSLIFNNSASYVQYSGFVKNNRDKKEGMTYYTSVSANLRGKNWGASANVSYNAPLVLVQGTSAGYPSSSISVNRNLFRNNRVNLAVSVNNWFNHRRNTIRELDDPTFHIINESETVVRRYNLSVNYRFYRVHGKR